jgi:hypothetical protein
VSIFLALTFSRTAAISKSCQRCFTTAAQLVNELIEAKNKSELNRVTKPLDAL